MVGVVGSSPIAPTNEPVVTGDIDAVPNYDDDQLLR